DGGLAWPNVNYGAASGINTWHGNANYFWTGRAMNANSWFTKQSQIASGLSNRPTFSNANQWSASIGGPIVKNKTFFFVDYEGLRVLLPTSTLTKIPSPQFKSATLANISATDHAQLPFYQNMFNLYNSAHGAANARPIPGGSDGCDGTISLRGSPCALAFRSTAANFTPAWL